MAHLDRTWRRRLQSDQRALLRLRMSAGGGKKRYVARGRDNAGWNVEVLCSHKDFLQGQDNLQ
jgi:hypothetical protein